MELPASIFPEAISPKQIVFMLMTLGFLAVAIPAALKYTWMDKACIAGILFMTINPIDITLYSYTNYRGDIRGIQFGVTDWLTITIIIAMMKAKRWQKYKIHLRHPNIILMLMYLLACSFSIFTALVPQFAFFGVTKLLRAYLLFWIAFNFIRSEEDLMFIIKCVIGITFYSFVEVLLDKYTRGVFPPRGSFMHQNGLATFQNLMNFFIFAFLIGDGEKKLFDKASLLYWAGLGTGVLTTLATLSRGGMATMFMGFAMIVIMSFWLKQKSRKRKRKLTAIGVMIAMALPAMAFVLPSIIKRFEEAPKGSKESRDVVNIAALKMADDYFFGVGFNNFSFAINFMKYKDGIIPLDRGIAHHIFILHYAELGIIGLTLFVLMTFGFVVITISFILKRKDSLERNFAIACLTGFVVTWLIGTLEWNFRTLQITLTYFMFAGFATSLERVESERIKQTKQDRLRMIYIQTLACRTHSKAMKGRPDVRRK